MFDKTQGRREIKETDFEMKGDVKDNAEGIIRRQDEREYNLKDRPKW